MNIIPDNEVNDLRFLDRIFDLGIDGLTTARSILSPNLQVPSASPGEPTLRLNFSEDENNYYARLDIPGVNKEDINIEVEEGELRIRAFRKEKQCGENEHVFQLERKFVVGEQVNSEKIEAKLDSGVLQVTLPKSEKIKPHVVSVN